MAGDMYLENIEEYVFDEDKVVTYKWLSQTLSLHVNQAKQMLDKFVQEQRKKPNQSINVTYVVSGEQDTEAGVKVSKIVIVREDELQSTESKFSKVSGKHVYSVQKNLLKDVNPLYMVDYQITKENIMQSNKHSAIQYSAAKPRSTEQLETLEQRAHKLAGKDEPTLVNGHAHKEMPKASDSTVSKSLSSASSRGKKKGPMDMFAAKASTKAKKETTVDSKDNKKDDKVESKEQKKEEKKPAKQTSSKPKGGMMAFLTKANTASQSSSQSKKPSPEKPKEEEKKEEVKKETTKKTSEIEVSSDSEPEEVVSKKSTKRVVKQGRRRIVRQEVSSSSSEEEDDDEDDEPIPPTPPPAARVPSEDEEEDEEKEEEEEKMEISQESEKTQETSTTPGGKKRKRKRVLKSKTSIDEDGCMVTEKVWESEWTDVSDEEPPPPKKKAAAVTKATKEDEEEEGGKKKGKGKKKTPPSKGKQSNLMSFFKKK